MGMLVRAAVLMSPFLLCNAFLDLTGSNEIKSIWKGSTTLPCVYVPVKDFVLETLIWTVEHDQSSGAIFRRDGSGDHVLLSEYRGRLSVLKDSPGNLSLHILNLEISDRGTYTCQVTWRASNNSLVAREITTKLEVVKVAVTKPIIRAGELGLTVPAGARTSLTCVASGSPPIWYRWFRGAPGGTALPLGSGAELAWDSLQPSDTGTYFCQAENRAGSGAVQQSDPIQLTVSDLSTVTVSTQRDVGITGIHHPTTDLPVAIVTSESGVGYPEKNYTTQSFQGSHLSLFLVILIAVVCSAVVFVVIFLIICIRKPKDAQVYEVKFHNLRAAASSRYDSTGHYEDPISCADSNYVMEPLKSKECEEINKKNNEYECLGNTQESEYELGDTV
ncbi:V-set and immunoglobulin domain-containing protein 4-like [Phaethornis superciliosus]